MEKLDSQCHHILTKGKNKGLRCEKSISYLDLEKLYCSSHYPKKNIIILNDRINDLTNHLKISSLHKNDVNINLRQLKYQQREQKEINKLKK